MASQNLKKLTKYVPLWQRHIPKYPLYVKGNPQLRVFLPLFWMKMIRPKHKIPEDHVCFEVHPQMTVFDIENYLKKIYDVNVLAVRTRLVKGKEMEVFGPAGIRDDNKRIAFVQLEEKFEIPDMFTEHPSADQKSMEQYDTMQKDHKKAFKRLGHSLMFPRGSDSWHIYTISVHHKNTWNHRPYHLDKNKFVTD